ncbi:DUF397 domain-containing protein [Actinomadura formosensis]|uniref:DUF397 domain-containing protein n=1 Tax=Actinomadura formosensis TaxID=60706 RepID=UPI003D92F77A
MGDSKSRLSAGIWRKSRRSEGIGDCVEVTVAHWVGVRDSKDPDGAVLWFTGDEWKAFLAGVKNGEFDLR